MILYSAYGRRKWLSQHAHIVIYTNSNHIDFSQYKPQAQSTIELT